MIGARLLTAKDQGSKSRNKLPPKMKHVRFLYLDDLYLPLGCMGSQLLTCALGGVRAKSTRCFLYFTSSSMLLFDYIDIQHTRSPLSFKQTIICTYKTRTSSSVTPRLAPSPGLDEHPLLTFTPPAIGLQSDIPRGDGEEDAEVLLQAGKYVFVLREEMEMETEEEKTSSIQPDITNGFAFL